MRILNLETTMPYRIGDGFKPDFIKQGKALEFMNWAEPRSRKVAVICGQELMYVKPTETCEGIFWSKGTFYEIGFFMLLKKFKLTSAVGSKIPDFLLKECFQLEMWRTGDFTFSEPGKSFVTQVLNKFLITSNKNLIAEGSESDSNLKSYFWMKRFMDALCNKEQRVWLVNVEIEDRNASITSYRKMEDKFEVLGVYSEGQDLSGCYRRLMITKA